MLLVMGHSGSAHGNHLRLLLCKHLLLGRVLSRLQVHHRVCSRSRTRRALAYALRHARHHTGLCHLGASTHTCLDLLSHVRGHTGSMRVSWSYRMSSWHLPGHVALMAEGLCHSHHRETE